MYDFKTNLLFRLYYSGLSIADIANIFHHKHTSVVRNHLMKYKHLLDDDKLLIFILVV